VLAVMLSACAPGEGDTVVDVQRSALTTFVFQDGLNGYAGTRDTTLRSSTADENRGNRDDVRVGSTLADGTQVGLFSWDVSSVPPGATVTAAVVTFVVANPESRPVEARLVRRGWVELEATWNRASSIVAWSTPGANGVNDVTPPFAELSCTGGTCTLDIPAAAVQVWLDMPAQNYGIQLRIASPQTSDFRVWSRDDTLQLNRPALRLDVLFVGDGGRPDAGPADAGSLDAGSPVDAGPVPDAGAAPVDGGVGQPVDYGLGCACSDAAGLVPVALLFLLRRRRSDG
jgi:uncharacterized protein (TIGR03382 family)